MTLPMPSPQRRHALRRMKIGATGLLVGAAAVFVVCVTVGDGHGAWGWVQAAVEASMVGGLADWFAVTAVFRHPLGIPIPHTAVIAQRKDQFGATLAEFVQQNFLSPDVIGERLRGSRLTERAATWLTDQHNAATVAEHGANVLVALGDTLRDEDVHRL